MSIIIAMIPQKFIIAVSGGVDSIVLLDMLIAKKPDNITYIVAHFDHGIRENSSKDAAFVELIAKNLQLAFELGQGGLGEETSENMAREARYAFLRSVKEKYKAEKIITAHHQDDFLETIVMNLLRGTGPRGLNPMQGQHDILRPLLRKTKADIIDYAKKNKLKWREDPTNSDEKFMRNYIRRNIMPKLSSNRRELLHAARRIEEIYQDVDARIQYLLPRKNILSRTKFVQYPYIVQKELLYVWLQRSGVQDVDKKLVERMVVACKTLPIGKRIDIKNNLCLLSEKQNLLLVSK